MTRVFRSGEEIKVFIDEEFDIRIDDVPEGTYARPLAGGLLTTSGSTGDRQEGGVTFFHFKAIAEGIQKVEFPPTMLTQNVEIQNLVGVPIEESAGEAVAAEPFSETNPLPLTDIVFEPAGMSPLN